MNKGKFKFKNTGNWTTEDVKGVPVKGNTPHFIGTMTHADKDYLYGEFEHDGDNDIFIEFSPSTKVIFSMEILND